MSDSVAFALVISNFIPSAFLAFWLSHLAMEKGAEIATGIRRGAPIPTMTRWMMLYTVFVCWAMAAVGASLFSVVLNLKIAAQVASTDLKLVAHLAAFLQAIVVFTWAVMGPLHFIHYRSILHQAKAD